MMKNLLAVAIIILLAGCKNSKNNHADLMPPLFMAPKTVLLNVDDGFAINPVNGDSIKPLLNKFGETIITGRPIPAIGKIIPDSLVKPKLVDVRTPQEVFVHANVQKIPKSLSVLPVKMEELPFIPFEKQDSSFVLVNEIGDTIPTGVPLHIKGKVVPCRYPQPIPAQPAVLNNKFLNFDVEQGLNTSYLTSILQDSKGNLWFGTVNSGVNKYNGNTFTHFTAKEGFTEYETSTIQEDKNGNLWFGVVDYGLIKFDGQNFTHFTSYEGLFNTHNNPMLFDKNGNLWIGKGDYEDAKRAGVKKYDGNSFTIYSTNEGLLNNDVLSMTEDKSGNLWFGFGGTVPKKHGGVMKYDGSRFTYLPQNEVLSDKIIEKVLEDKMNNFWFLTAENGAYTFDGSSLTHFDKYGAFNNNYTTDIQQDKSGNIWFGTMRDGAILYKPSKDGKGGSFTYSIAKEGLSNNQIWNILQDTGGNMWFSTTGSGMIELNNERFEHFDEKGGLSYKTVYPILEDRNGRLWFGIEGGGVNIYDGERFYHYTESQGLLDNYVRAILEDNGGNIWLGTRKGLVKYDGRNFTNVVSMTWVLCITEDVHGDLWFGSEEGLTQYSKRNQAADQPIFTQYSTKESLTNNRVRTILNDKSGNIWFGTWGGGITKYEPAKDGHSGTFTHFTEKEGLINNTVCSILEDKYGNLWIATYGGISRFDGQYFTQFTTNEGLSHNRVYSILEDKNGNLWFGTEKGIDCLLHDSFNFKEGRAEPNNFTGAPFINFNQYNGLNGIDFMVGSSFLDSKNRAWWGTGKNLSMLDLNSFTLPKQIPNIQLDYITINDQFLDFRNFNDSTKATIAFDSVARFCNYPLNLTVPFNNNHLTFYFSAIDWAAPRKLMYSYKIDELNDNWSSPSTEAKAEYRNLPPGKHTFKVRAIGESQRWSEPFAYTFTVLPPWWQTWWAYSLYGLGILALFWGIRQYELNRLYARSEAKRLMELDGVKTRLYTNITHEFRTPLTVIMGMADQLNEEACQQAGSFSSKVTDRCKLILRNAGNLLHLVNQMLDLSKLDSGKLDINWERGDVVIFLHYLSDSFHSYAESKNIKLTFYPEVNELEMAYDQEKLQHIVSNLISNAIKYTPEHGKIFFHVSKIEANSPQKDSRLTKDMLQVKISDTGVGIPDEHLAHIFDRFYQVDASHTRKAEGTGIGLTLTKELVELMGGNISVSSEEGKGTQFTFQLPIQERPEVQPVKEVNLRPLAHEFEREITAAVQAATTTPAEAINADQPLLLIIEDNPDVAVYIRTCMEAQYAVIWAKNGQLGIEKAVETVPDIIISDVMMPEKDGFEVTQFLKNDELTSHIPIILLTAKADIESRIAGLERGADAYLAKPFDKKELQVRVEKLVELRIRLQAHYSGNNTFSLSLAKEKENSKTLTDKGIEIEDAFLKKANAAIEEQLSNPDFQVPQMCRAMRLSQSQLYRKIKALTDKSIAAYIRSYRLHKGHELLQNSRMTVSEVAYEVGFSDPHYFSRTFTEEFGFPPIEVRH